MCPPLCNHPVVAGGLAASSRSGFFGCFPNFSSFLPKASAFLAALTPFPACGCPPCPPPCGDRPRPQTPWGQKPHPRAPGGLLELFSTWGGEVRGLGAGSRARTRGGSLAMGGLPLTSPFCCSHWSRTSRLLWDEFRERCPFLGGKKGGKKGGLTPPVPAGSGVALRKLCELRAGERCCVVGTLFKAMQLQPSILQEISEEVRRHRAPRGAGGGTGDAGGAGGAGLASPSLAEPLPPWLTAAALLASRGSAKWKQPREARSWTAAPRAAGPLLGAAPACPDPQKTPPPHSWCPHVQHNLVPQPPMPKYVHPSDELILEDELQRIKLVGDIEVAKLVTGRARRLGTGWALPAPPPLSAELPPQAPSSPCTAASRRTAASWWKSSASLGCHSPCPGRAPARIGESPPCPHRVPIVSRRSGDHRRLPLCCPPSPRPGLCSWPRGWGWAAAAASPCWAPSCWWTR